MQTCNCGYTKIDHGTISGCRWRPTNRREPSYDWILILVWGIVFGIGLGFGYCFFTSK